MWLGGTVQLRDWGGPGFFPDAADLCYRVRARDEAKKSRGPALQALIYLSNVETALVQDQDPNLQVVRDMLHAIPEFPEWEHMHVESAEVKPLWSQYPNLRMRYGILLHCR